MKSTYNTRRKSVSLTALGVQLPGRSRASTESKAETSTTDSEAQHNVSNSPPSKRVKTSHSPSSPQRASPQRPGSRQRKSTSPTSAAASGTSETAAGEGQSKVKHGEHSRPKSRHVEYTPPPSPREASESKIDYEIINDDIVEGVVTQLEKTGNRPHLIRELAAILATTNDSVTSSANAPALLSSRLASFMKRGCWGPSNPCPVGKELIPVHPRKVFYYLTDRPRQELPNTSDDIYAPLGISSQAATPNHAGSLPNATPTSAGMGIMGPPAQIPNKRPYETTMPKFQNDSPPLSIASATGDDDSVTNADERRERWAPSPSPEVDLTIHEVHSEYGDDFTEKKNNSTSTSNTSNISIDASNGSSTNSVSRRHGVKHELEPPRQLHLNTRAQSPRVEGDEREFRDTVFSLRASPTDRKEPASAPTDNKMDGVLKEAEESQERESRRLPDYEMDTYASGSTNLQSLSSPAFPAQAAAVFTPKQAAVQNVKAAASVEDVLMADDEIGSGLYRWDLNAPKDIDVDELDMLLEGC